MSAFSNYLENALLDVVLRNVPYASATTVYVGLNSADPVEVGANELSGFGYARQPSGFDAPVSGSCANSADVTFTASGSDWVQVTHFTIWDAASGGNCLYQGTLNAPRTVVDTDSAVFPTGALVVEHQ